MRGVFVLSDLRENIVFSRRRGCSKSLGGNHAGMQLLAHRAVRELVNNVNGVAGLFGFPSCVRDGQRTQDFDEHFSNSNPISWGNGGSNLSEHNQFMAIIGCPTNPSNTLIKISAPMKMMSQVKTFLKTSF